MLKTLLVDDEHDAHIIMTSLLGQYCPEVEIIGSAYNVAEAVSMINTHKPDLVFLDIQMPEQSGFQLLDQFESIDFEIIFVTAFSEFALRAFQVSAADYLMKPVDVARLKQAVSKVDKQLASSESRQKYSLLKTNLKTESFTRMALPVSDGLIFIELKDIVYLNADGPYCNVLTNSGQKYLVSKTLKKFEELLSSSPKFFRPHRSFLINMDYVQKFLRQDGGYVVLQDEHQIPIVKDKVSAFYELLNTMRF